MNKTYRDIDEFLKETFPDVFHTSEQDTETTIQYYINKASREFSSEIKKIIQGQSFA